MFRRKNRPAPKPPRPLEDLAPEPTFQEGMLIHDRVAYEKELARRIPDIPWRQWALYSGLKVWLGLGFLIVDSILAAFWVENQGYVALALSLALVVYLEFLLYRYLWYVPSEDHAPRRGPFKPSWHRPVEFGRWTPEAARARAGLGPTTAPQGPDPREFL